MMGNKIQLYSESQSSNLQPMNELKNNKIININSSKIYTTNHVAQETRTVKELSEKLINGELSIPPWQRNSDAWPISTKMKFIDSIFTGFYIPSLIVLKGKDSEGRIVYYLDDGLQRLTTLCEYRENKFPYEFRKEKNIYDSLIKYEEDDDEEDDDEEDEDEEEEEEEEKKQDDKMENYKILIYYSELPQKIKSNKNVKYAVLSPEQRMDFDNHRIPYATGTRIYNTKRHIDQFNRIQYSKTLNVAETLKTYQSNSLIHFITNELQILIQVEDREVSTKFRDLMKRCESVKILFVILQLYLLDEKERKLLFHQTDADRFIKQFEELKPKMKVFGKSDSLENKLSIDCKKELTECIVRMFKRFMKIHELQPQFRKFCVKFENSVSVCYILMNSFDYSEKIEMKIPELIKKGNIIVKKPYIENINNILNGKKKKVEKVVFVDEEI